MLIYVWLRLGCTEVSVREYRSTCGYPLFVILVLMLYPVYKYDKRTTLDEVKLTNLT